MKKNISNKIIIGTRSLSGDMGTIKKDQARNIIETSINLGLKHFDTAPFYGNGSVDNILKDYKKDLIIDTKCGYNKNFSVKTFSIDDIKYSLNSSLEKFEKINIFYIHNPRNEVKNWDKIFDLLSSFKKQKCIKHFGLSIARGYTFNSNILNFFDFIQDDINLLRNSPLQYLSLFNGNIYARSPFASGCLSGKLNLKSKFKKLDYRYDWLKGERLKSILKQVDAIKNIYQEDIKKLSIGYLLKKKKIKKVIVGIKKIEHLFFLDNLDNKIKVSTIEKIDYLNKLGFYLDGNEVGY